jgi:hypothetical protein
VCEYGNDATKHSIMDGKGNFQMARWAKQTQFPPEVSSFKLEVSSVRTSHFLETTLRRHYERAGRAKQSQFAGGQMKINCWLEKGLWRKVPIMRRQKQSQFAGKHAGVAASSVPGNSVAIRGFAVLGEDRDFPGVRRACLSHCIMEQWHGRRRFGAVEQGRVAKESGK